MGRWKEIDPALASEDLYQKRREPGGHGKTCGNADGNSGIFRKT